MNRLKDKVAVITGGSAGIGFATAKRFVQEGAYVVITGRRIERLEQAVAELGDQASFVQCDTADLVQLDALYQTVGQKYSKIDVLVVNAGVVERVPVSEVTEQHFDWTSDINFKGAFFATQKALPLLSDNASVIFIASVAGVRGFKNISIYSATKAAVIELAKSFAADHVGSSKRFNVISPGYIETELTQGVKDDKPQYDAVCANVPLGHRFGRPEEIANVALFLASDASTYMTGQNLEVDGGMVAVLQEKIT